MFSNINVVNRVAFETNEYFPQLFKRESSFCLLKFNKRRLWLLYAYIKCMVLHKYVI